MERRPGNDSRNLFEARGDGAGVALDAASHLRHHRLVEKRCSQCGAAMTCQPEGGCWCAELPHCMPMPTSESEGCLCRKCLLARMEALQESAKTKRA